ncbi:MAG: sugar phosphate isomerase/epimerase [Lentisphaeria bacterium]|nr:sugar phosphate isomerase/epimerase [Lentisphaeria bacterium]
MFLTGFADEAGGDLAVQIKATQELGWKFIESRGINGKNLATLSDEEFEKVSAQLNEAGIKINCYGSAIANWAKHPRKQEDFEASKMELLNAIPRMQKLGIKMLRGMSFATPTDEEPDSPELEKIIFAKVNELVKICEDAGIIYGHENCMNYGGLSFKHTLKLLENIKSPNLKLIFDTGNPVFNYRWIGEKPYPLQSSWEFYQNVKEFIAYIHIKDGTALPKADGVTRPECNFCYAGDGEGDVRAIVIDLRKSGYDGGFSIEPHIASVYHAETRSEDKAAISYNSYIEYGKRFEKLLRDCGWNF